MENVKLSEFTPDPRNANKGTVRGRGLLEKSLQDLGAGRSILVDKHGTAIAGNKTLSVAIESGFENAIVVETDGTRLVVVKRTDLDLGTDEKAKLLAVGDNRASEVGLEWDAEVLAELSQEVDLSGFFFSDELAALLEEPPPEPPTAEEDEETTADLMEQAEAGAIESRVSLGQIWQIGRHFIACGDSTDEGNVKKLLGDRQIDLLVTDPPYGVKVVGGSKDPRARTHKSGKTIQNDDMQGEELKAFLVACFAATNSKMRDGACYYIAHPDIFAYEFIGAVRDVGWRQARPAVVLWIKDSLVFGQGDYHSRSEPILYGWKPGAAHKPVSDRTQDNVWEFDRPKNVKDIHPSVKPVELFAQAIENSSDARWLVYDPFLGSGTTIIAAQQMEGDRTVYGFELSPDYCEVCLRRFESFTGVNAELVGHL